MFTFENEEFTGFIDFLSHSKSNSPRILFALIILTISIILFGIWFFFYGQYDSTQAANPMLGGAIIGIAFLVARAIVIKKYFFSKEGK